MSPRLSLARDAGLDLAGPLSVLLPGPDQDLSGLPESSEIVQPFKPFHDHFAALGWTCVPDSDSPCRDVLIFLPRAKQLARGLVAAACRRATGTIAIDGAKTDGIDSLLRDIRRRVAVEGVVAKAHGKIFWFQSDPRAFADWTAPERLQADGYLTAPGIFSADGIDPASRLLADALPETPGRHVADLGAGWGYLGARLLTGSTKIETFDLVEAHHTALACARANIHDPRARFHWADARSWTPPGPVDAVVMNPPFHSSRTADPDLGRAFIAAAARCLSPGGRLWLVANRHLPYETALAEHFSATREIGGDNRFKLLFAERPSRPRR